MLSQPEMETYLRHSATRKASLPSKIQPDHLSPTNSRLLTLALSDHIPSLPSFAHSRSAALPWAHHLVYFPIQAPNSCLSPDGTDPDHAPGAPFVRRMWAGAAVRYSPGWEESLVLDGRRAVCVETVGAPMASSKGDKVFVEVRRRYGLVLGVETEEDAARRLGRDEGDGVVMEEVRRLVFMEERGPPTTATASIATETKAQPEAGRDDKEVARDEGRGEKRIVRAPGTPDYSFTMRPDAALLFQFSALTYNAHAIHLDADYARNVEGYPERLVHGPLTQVLMLTALRQHLQQRQQQAACIKMMEYRNLAPLFVGRELRVCVRGLAQSGDGNGDRKWQLWVEGPEGGLAVKGTATTGSTSQKTRAAKL